MSCIRDAKRIIHNMYELKVKIGIMFVLLFSIFIISSKALINITPTGIDVGVLDLMVLPSGGGIFSSNSYLFPIAPFFIFIFNALMSFDKRNLVYFRQGNRKKIIMYNGLIAVIWSAIFSVVTLVGGYVIAGVLSGGFENNWHSENSYIFNIIGNKEIWENHINNLSAGLVIIIIFLVMFLGLCVIAYANSIISLYINKFFSATIIIIIILVDVIGKLPKIITFQMSLTVKNWVNMESILINMIYMICIFFILNFIGSVIIDKIDFV